MARAKLSSLFVSLAGRYGGGVFRDWKGITVLSVLPQTVANPNTDRQVKARNVVSVASKAWKGMDAETRAGWGAVGTYLSDAWEHYQNEVGDDSVIKLPRGPFGPMQALIAVHGLLRSIGSWSPGDPMADPPVGISGPSAPATTTVTGNTSKITVTCPLPASWGQGGSAGKLRCWIRSEDGKFFPQLQDSNAAGSFEITKLRVAGSGAEYPLTKGWYAVQVDAVNAEGLRGTPGPVVWFRAEPPANP